MLEHLLAIAAYLLPLLLDWLAGKRGKTADEKCREDIGRMHGALADGDAAVISDLYDELRIPHAPGRRQSDPGGPDGDQAAQRQL
jgi:hypothetical protein